MEALTCVCHRLRSNLPHDGTGESLSQCARGACSSDAATVVEPSAWGPAAPAARCRGAAQKRRDTATTPGADSATPSSAPRPCALLATPCGQLRRDQSSYSCADILQTTRSYRGRSYRGGHRSKASPPSGAAATCSCAQALCGSQAPGAAAPPPTQKPHDCRSWPHAVPSPAASFRRNFSCRSWNQRSLRWGPGAVNDMSDARTACRCAIYLDSAF